MNFPSKETPYGSVLEKLIFPSGVLFQFIFLFELFFFADILIVDPTVHHVTYDNWMYWLDWPPPDYWQLHSELFILIARSLSLVFQLVFSAILVHVFLYADRFSLRRRTVVILYLLFVLIEMVLRYYFRYHVSFYRLFMYSTFTELLSFYVMFCGVRLKHSSS